MSARDYLAVLTAAILLAMVTVSVHAVLLAGVRRRLLRRIRGKSYADHVFREALVISATVLSLCGAHLLEILIWAAAFVWLGAIASPVDAFYFSISTYTTVGADGVSVDPHYRSLAGFESLIGPMMVAWSTAFLVEFVTRMRGPEKDIGR
ncbi:ion channel [Xanthobacter pseudotagetidis]|uniref:ion channel n=1 Tax=Xanthobacter pseudotagetidis TaxID=3119911 RepID=UPI003729B19B